MQDIVNPVQNISYTNKDFESVYTELLDLVKELTYKWDPSISNESDPGVVLLKLNAIIADKCNYNLDKNVLECFPLSVTQDPNARQLFEQLGYYMRWYNSATTNVTMKWIDETASYKETGILTKYVIPPFTMVSDSDGGIVYTLVGPAQEDETFLVDSQLLENNGTSLKFKAIQGVAVKYDINGETVITTSHLDSNNRIYFTNTNIAMNGIFITNTGSNNYSSWVRKDNLLVESLGNTYYKFGVSQSGETCYLEFPQDAETIFKDGIEITYIRTDGQNGNIAATQIEKFYNDITSYIYDDTTNAVTDDTQLLNSDNVKITNYFAAVNGADPESINDAYDGYKKTIGTFNTLVTIRDYINAIVGAGVYASNGFVCDRTNDIQRTYKVISSVNDVDQTVTLVEPDIATHDGYVTFDDSGTQRTVYATYTCEEPSLTPFSLKLYLLQYSNATKITTAAEYNSTFNLLRTGEYDASGILRNSDIENIKAYIADNKSVQHDYATFVSPTATSSHFCFFKNKYPVYCTITPQYQLTDTQKSEVRANIMNALYTALNSKKINFGDEIEFDLVYQTILNADTRIKSVSLNNIDYTTYAVYWDGTVFHDDIPVSEATDTLTFEYSADGNVTVSSYVYSTFETKVGLGNYGIVTFLYTENGWECSDGSTYTTAQLGTVYGLTVTGTPQVGSAIYARISLNKQFRDEVYVKSVLGGVTQLLVQDTEFAYALNQIVSANSPITNIEKLSTNVNIAFSDNSTTGQSKTDVTLQPNENVQFYAPNLIDGSSYSDYVKFEYHIGVEVLADSVYQLRANEYIMFYWRSTDSEDAIYDYYLYGPGNIINPTITLEPFTSTIKGAALVPADLTTMRNIGTATNPKYVKSSSVEGAMPYNVSQQIATITGTSTDPSGHVLSGTSKITIKNINQITLDDTYVCYWITGDRPVINGVERYRLFEAPEEYSTTKTYAINDVVQHEGTAYRCITTISVAESWTPAHWSSSNVTQSRLLNTGEYFIYSNSELTDLAVLGSGTTITRSALLTDWTVVAISATSILDGGADILDTYWKELTDSNVQVTENQYVTIGPGCQIHLEPSSPWECYNISVWKVVGATETVSTDLSVNPSTWMANTRYGKTIGRFTFTYSNSTHKWYSDNVEVNLADYGLTLNVTLSADAYYAIHVTNEWTLTFNHERPIITQPSSHGEVRVRNPQLSDFGILYTTTPGSEDWQSVADISLAGSVGWQGRSLLSISTTSSKEQILRNNQSVTYTKTDGTTGTINGADLVKVYSAGQVVQSYYPVCIMTSFAVDIEGGEEVTTTLVDENGETEYLTIYQFQKIVSDINLVYTADGGVSMTFDPGDADKSFSFSLPAGDYVLPFTASNTRMTALTFKLDGTLLAAMHDSTKTDFSEGGTHYLKMTLSSVTTHTLTVHVAGQATSVSVVLSNCYKYSKPADMTASEFNRMLQLLAQWDTGTNGYNYTYVVDDDSRIDNPLEAASFLKSQHIFNKFTICQLDTTAGTTEKITIVGKK